MLEREPADLTVSLQRYRAALGAFLANAPTGYYRSTLPTSGWPFEAEVLSTLGRHAEAAALIAKTPLDCYDCLRVRGVIAKDMGDRAGAQQRFLRAAQSGPGLAPAFLDWGRLLLENRRLNSAEVKLREAARLAPTWADPLKYWGDLLAAQGKRKEAMAKYDVAAKLAPKWVELRQARSRIQAVR